MWAWHTMIQSASVLRDSVGKDDLPHPVSIAKIHDHASDFFEVQLVDLDGPEMGDLPLMGGFNLE